jgi:hypothetical protein
MFFCSCLFWLCSRSVHHAMYEQHSSYPEATKDEVTHWQLQKFDRLAENGRDSPFPHDTHSQYH